MRASAPSATDAISAAEAQAAVAEHDISWVRFAVIVFNSLLYASLLPHGPRHMMAVAVALAALAYGTMVVLAQPYQRFPVLQTAGWTVLTDSLLIIVWLYSTGGLESPFYALWLLSLFAITFRFKRDTVVVATGLYALADIAMLAWSGDIVPENAALIAARVSYILLVGALGALLSQRWSEAMDAKIGLTKQVARHEEDLREADRLRLLSDATFEGIIIHRDGVILEANTAAGALFGQDRDALIGMHCSALLASVGIDEQVQADEDPIELWIERKGQRRRIMVQGRDIVYQNHDANVAALRDITEHYEAEQARALAREREQEIERLHEANRFRSQFINTAAHELNTPLTPIKLQFAIIRNELQDRPRALGILERNLDRLAGLVQDMLDVARLDTGRFRVHPRQVDVIPLLHEMAETFQATSLDKGVMLEVLAPDRLPAFADPDRVVQILTNLLSNAFKFTPRNGHVHVVARDIRGGIRIEVVDTGSGLDPSAQRRLFQPFSQLHDDPSIPGSGLGLYICMGLAEAMDGRMGVDSAGTGKGAAFWLELPARQVVPEPLPTSS